ncbi:tRNA pseudouridine(13) synthase TruD [Candidatus Woesearchaeota archaeon]|nr:tRNA pseudouridine(13) synthase TruD [Candidatus Woesearchaeota archaeon]
MYKLKENPEDFIVIERSNVEIKDDGEFTYFVLKKKNYNTSDAIQRIADTLRYNSKDIGFAGNKDRRAITEQLCSIKNISKEKLESLKLKDIDILVKGYGDESINLGMLEGNYFIINIKDINFKPKPITKFINYYGPQRFGDDNIEIGRSIIKKDFKNLEKFNLSVNKINQSRRLSRIYIHAYQSYLWNKSVERLISKGIEVDEVPIVGFGTEFKNDSVEEVCKEVLKEEGIKKRDFIIRQCPDLSAEGDVRKVYCDVSELEISELENNQVTVKFFLPKGCYATVFIEQLLSS